MLFGIPLAAILKITFIDLVLSGDNAVVIAMAARSLPPTQQKKAITFGGAAAIVLRVLVTAVVAYALKIPLLQLAGGLMLFWIAVKLLRGGDEETKDVKASNSMLDAIGTIVLADFVMSLDNMLAVGGASEGSLELLLFGLMISMGIIMFASSVIAKLMNKYGWLVYIGAGILGYTAGEMILRDKWLAKLYEAPQFMEYLFPAIMAAAVLAIGFLLNRKQAQAEHSK